MNVNERTSELLSRPIAVAPDSRARAEALRAAIALLSSATRAIKRAELDDQHPQRRVVLADALARADSARASLLRILQ
jgi:hypothetical protein